MARSKYEIEAQKELEADGWRVDYKARPFRVPRNYNVDYFGLFDLLAHRNGNPIRWISIKGKAGIPGPHRRAVEGFWFPRGHIKEIWQYNPKRKSGRVKKETIK